MKIIKNILMIVSFTTFSHNWANLEQASLNNLSKNQTKPESSAVDYSKMPAAELDTAFVLAVKKRHIEKMQQLIQAGANVNTPIPYTWTEGDCDWDCKDTAFMYAVKNGYPGVIEVLLTVKGKLNESFNEALKVAIREGRSGVVKLLIKGGADINYSDNENRDTPLILAVKTACATGEFYTQAQARSRSRWDQRREIIQTLLKAGANVGSVNSDGRTALMEAVIEHDLKTVLSLLEISQMHTGSFFDFGTAPKNYADNDGNTALIYAIKYVQTSHYDSYTKSICANSLKIMGKLFRSPGIDLHYVNNKGETFIALYKEKNEEMKKIEHSTISI